MLSLKLVAELDSRWAAQKEMLKLKFSQLTDEDLAFDRTRKSEMLTNLRDKLGATARELNDIMEL